MYRDLDMSLDDIVKSKKNNNSNKRTGGQRKYIGNRNRNDARPFKRRNVCCLE